ncbi:uncharacterized protein LOC141534625 [Cotesia typhae]|uniref:uncharacterized protein LOC141534625 n=1 Tax=Cotesia typhae TaxID=2053667 RepID=UPI003D6868BA
MRNNEPILDPYNSNEQIMEYDDGTLMINGKLSDFIVYNLSNYIVKNSNVNIWNRKVTIELNFPTITSNGFYNLDARYKNIPYIGNGYYNVTVRDFSLSAEVYIKIIGGVQVKSLDLKISIGDFDFLASSDSFGDEEESKDWSANISQLVPTVIDEHHDPIVAFVTPKIIAVINQQLQKNLLKNDNNNADISISNVSGYNTGKIRK